MFSIPSDVYKPTITESIKLTTPKTSLDDTKRQLPDGEPDRIFGKPTKREQPPGSQTRMPNPGIKRITLEEETSYMLARNRNMKRRTDQKLLPTVKKMKLDADCFQKVVKVADESRQCLDHFLCNV